MSKNVKTIIKFNRLKLNFAKNIKKNIFNNIVKFGSKKLQDIYANKQMFNLINLSTLCIKYIQKYIF
jgi:hypothetical protein